MDLSSPETIWSNLTSKNRNMIRKAQKAGIRIFNGRNAALFHTFRDLYNETMEKNEASSYYYFSEDFYESILADLAHNAQIFSAEKDDQIIAASIILATNNRLNYHLSGSKHEYRHLAPSNLLLYEAALWGSANGYRTFHLGGGVGSQEDGLYLFKKAFCRKEPTRYCIGGKVFLSEQYEHLSATHGSGSSNGSFFPAYRG